MVSNNNKILIIFPDQWIPYSPSILNLIESLKNDYTVSIFCINTNEFDHSSLDKVFFSYFSIPKAIAKIAEKCKILGWIKFVTLILVTFKKRFDCIIGVDSVGALVAQLNFNRYIFYSLEVKKDIFLKLLDLSKIIALITQTEERKKFLFGDCQLPAIYIQNAPVFPGIFNKTHSNDLVYFGNICKEHGVMEYLKVLAMNTHYRLTLKGRIDAAFKELICKLYQEFMATQRLVIDERYIPQNDVINFLRPYSLGFCFYDFIIIDKNDFNYLSCPSGKMFNYFAAGIPVLGQDIPGLQSVKMFNAGILLKELSSEKIIESINMIFQNYNQFVQGCFRAAIQFDFSRTIGPLKKYLDD